MPNLNIPFGGQTLIIPGAYYADNVTSGAIPAPPTTPPLIFIGYGYCQSYVPQTYNSPSQLLAALRGGPASDFVSFLTAPSPVLNGAQQITFISVGGNTQSALTLNSGASGVVTMTSAQYGLPSNLLQAQVQTGAAAGKLLTLYDGYAGVSAVGNNLGVPFNLAYTGTATGVTYSVVVSAGASTTFTTNSPNAGESVSIPLNAGSFASVTAIVEYLNGTGYYSASVLSSTNGALPSTQLDAASAVALASGGVTFVNVYAQLSDLVYWVNQFASNLATATIVSGVTSSSGVAPTNIGLTPFSGATSTPPVLSNYASGFNVALATPGWTVFADSGASGVIALGAQHANTASAPAQGKWRRFFTGSALGDTVAIALTKSQSMNSYPACFVYPGIYRTSTTTGLNTLYDGLHAAAAAAGMATGNYIATPLTNKALTGNGVEAALTTSQIDQLQQGAVMPIAISTQTGAPTIVSDFTTWHNDANPENVFTQQVACRFALAYTVVNALQPYVGTIASTLTETLILNAVKSALNSAVYTPNNPNGVINSWNPATLVLVYTGNQQLAAVTVSVQLVGQNRFITAYVSIQPLNIVISAASGPVISV